MKSILRKSSTPYVVVIAAVCLVVLSLGTFFVSRAQAASTELSVGERLITVHDRGQERGLLTHATTLRQAFKEASIQIDPNDRVEPGMDDSLLANNYEVNIYRARPVTIVDGAIREKVMSPYQTARQIADQAGVTLHDEDKTVIDANTNIISQGTGVQLTITRATPFTLVLYGTKMVAYTQAKTVADMLKQKNITLGKDDTLSVVQTAPMSAGMTIELWRNGKQTANEEQDIAFDIERVQDADHEVGYREIKTPGELGKKTVTFEIEMKNGQEVGRKEIQSVTTKEPKKQVEIVGTKMTNTFSGSFAQALARLRGCEAGGVYSRNSGNGYYGAYQYNISTWANYQGYRIPSDAPAAVQDERAWITYQGRGWQPWPSCSRSQGLQDIYR